MEKPYVIEECYTLEACRMIPFAPVPMRGRLPWRRARNRRYATLRALLDAWRSLRFSAATRAGLMWVGGGTHFHLPVSAAFDGKLFLVYRPAHDTLAPAPMA